MKPGTEGFLSTRGGAWSTVPGSPGVVKPKVSEDVSVDPPIDRHDQKAGDDDERRQVLERDLPCVDPFRHHGADVRNPDGQRTGDQQCKVGADTKEGVEPFCLRDLRGIVSKPPKEKPQDGAAPQLGHDVEESVAPVPNAFDESIQPLPGHMFSGSLQKHWG